MTPAILAIVGGLVGLALGGELLVRGSVAIARRMGVSNLFTGLVIVGFATSMPEMVASVEAALLGSPQLAWGNIVGSNLANTLLILGVAALVTPIALTGTGKRDGVVALMATLVLWAITGAQLGGIWIGVGLLVALCAYIYWRYNHPRVVDEDEDAGSLLAIHWALLAFVAGLGLLIAGGASLVSGAIDVARLFGISETVIGLTVVAIGTSLPELAASVAAALRGKPGLALGNVLGSNIYNILLIGGVTMVVAPVPVPQDLLGYEFILLATSAVALVALLALGRNIGRAVGLALLVVFAANTAMALGS